MLFNSYEFIFLYLPIVLIGYFILGRSSNNKYTGFFQTANDIAGTEFAIPQIILPLGISFFTFTQTAYLVDAFRGETKNYSFWQFCLFVTVFPHLIAGPSFIMLI